MLQKWLVSVGGEYFPQPLLARQIGKWAGVGGGERRDGTGGWGWNYYSKLFK